MSCVVASNNGMRTRPPVNGGGELDDKLPDVDQFLWEYSCCRHGTPFPSQCINAQSL